MPIATRRRCATYAPLSATTRLRRRDARPATPSASCTGATDGTALDTQATSYWVFDKVAENLSTYSSHRHELRTVEVGTSPATSAREVVRDMVSGTVGDSRPAPAGGLRSRPARVAGPRPPHCLASSEVVEGSSTPVHSIAREVTQAC